MMSLAGDAEDSEVDHAWDFITAYYSSEKDTNVSNNLKVSHALDCLHRNDILKFLPDWFIYTVQNQLRRDISPRYWTKLKDSKDPVWIESVYFLHEELKPYISMADLIEEHLESYQWFGRRTHSSQSIDARFLRKELEIIIRAVIFHVIPQKLMTGICDFYAEAFRVFLTGRFGESSYNEEEDCQGCKQCPCVCSQVWQQFLTVNTKLSELGLLEKLSRSAVTNIVNQEIDTFIRDTCLTNFDCSYLSVLENWLDDKVLSWLGTIYPKSHTTTTSDFSSRIRHIVYETYAKTRIEQMFNIIIEFPDSEPAVLDLKECLEKTDLRKEVMKSLKLALETRLLHPGVNTADILIAYISAIRALRVLDPSGVILDVVCQPVRKYLRSREDTVKRIVESLQDDGASELTNELVKGEPLLADTDSDSDDDVSNWETWMPDPVDAHTTSKSRRVSDIISMLVNIYGSQELFVDEYRSLLANRILTSFYDIQSETFNYDLVKEFRYLELLKLRFGESVLHPCEVMLKDVADSRRINGAITKSLNEEPNDVKVDQFVVQAWVLSAQFWPSFREEQIALPASMTDALHGFTKRYEALKGNRTLVWKNHLGSVNIEIEWNDQVLNFTCSPVHAAIIYHFQHQTKWNIEDLSSVLQMSASVVRRKIAWWQGLLREESTDTYVIVDEPRALPRQPTVNPDEVESALMSPQSQRENELQVFWTYIVGMLTNLSALSLERIHKLLCMFNMQGTSSVSITELRSFLHTKIKQQKLLYSNDLYRLPE